MNCKLIYAAKLYAVVYNDVLFYINRKLGHESIVELVNDIKYNNMSESRTRLSGLNGLDLMYEIIYEEDCRIGYFLKNLYDNLYSTMPEELL